MSAFRRTPAEHINTVLTRVLSGMGAEDGELVASKEEYQELAAAAAGMVKQSFTRERKKKAAGLCLQYLRLSLRAPVAAEARGEEKLGVTL